MRSVPCYLCGSAERKVLFAQRGHDPYLDMINPGLHALTRNWTVCTCCGFVYRDPMPDAGELDVLYAAYERDVFRGTDSDAYFDRIVSLPPNESENFQKVRWLAEVMVTQGLGGGGRGLSVLDVGCGGGTLLHTLSGMVDTRRVCGVELNSAYAELASRRLDADVRCEAYSCGRFGEAFDLVVCTKVLEHVADPLPFLAGMVKDLVPRGLLFVEVPDIADIAVLPPEHERFFIPHLYYFSARTLGALLVRVGLAVIVSRSITTSRGRVYLQVVARHTEEYEGRISKPVAVKLPEPYDDSEVLLEKTSRPRGERDS